MQPLFLRPVFKEMIWGGTALRDLYHYEVIKQENVGRLAHIRMVTA